MIKVTFMVVCWVAAALAADQVGLDTSKPAVFLGAIVIGTVVAAVLLPSGNSKREQS